MRGVNDRESHPGERRRESLSGVCSACAASDSRRFPGGWLGRERLGARQRLEGAVEIHAEVYRSWIDDFDIVRERLFDWIFGK